MIHYQRLKDLRIDNDEKQTNISNILNIGISTYQRYERGELRIPFDYAVILANYYNVSLDYIAGKTNDKKGFNKSDLSSDEINLLKNFRILSDRKKGQIDLLIKQLVDEQIEENAKRKEAI